MTTLDKINGEAFSVHGLRFWGLRLPARPSRFSIIAQNERGAVELWSEKMDPRAREIIGRDTFGGVEIHSPVRPYKDWEPDITDCVVLDGNCWCDGSGLAYDETFLSLINTGNSRKILELLAEWHESRFGQPELTPVELSIEEPPFLVL